jgi:hypothetical protein
MKSRRQKESTAKEETAASAGLRWPVGEFYLSGLSSDGRMASIPGAADAHRRLFLVRAARLVPELLSTLRAADHCECGVNAWAARWHLTDQWCVLLAQDTKHWWVNSPGAEGWQFEKVSAAAGHFPFRIEPLQLGPFYYDPIWRKRQDFKKYVQECVRQSLQEYCARVEADAVAAGMKRAPRKRAIEHFDWLVRYQIKGESFASIAKTASYRFSGGRQTIHKAAFELAKYLALSLRPST